MLFNGRLIKRAHMLRLSECVYVNMCVLGSVPVSRERKGM